MLVENTFQGIQISLSNSCKTTTILTLGQTKPWDGPIPGTKPWEEPPHPHNTSATPPQHLHGTSNAPLLLLFNPKIATFLTFRMVFSSLCSP